jgi:hypothetical protein
MIPILVYAVGTIVVLASVSMLGCAILAHFTDDAAGAAGCIEEGQVW